MRLAGAGRATKHHLASGSDTDAAGSAPDGIVPLSPEGEALLARVRQPVVARQSIGYDRALLDGYRRNESFYWAYERSAARYGAVRQSLGEPDSFRLPYRDALRDIIREIVRGQMDRPAARAQLVASARDTFPDADQAQFVEVAETQLVGLHETGTRFAARWTKPIIAAARCRHRNGLSGRCDQSVLASISMRRHSASAGEAGL